MSEILVRAGGFVLIIVLGYVLRRVGFFQESDFKVLSKIVIKITLPAAIISSFNGKVIDSSMLGITCIALGSGIVYMLLAYLMNRKNGREQQAFEIINLSSYNIGNFTLPFVQSFLGPMGVITTSLFDVGNACIGLGGSYSIASMIKGHGGFSLKRLLKALFGSVPFVCHITMITTNLAHIPIPAIVYSVTDIIGGANAFIAMLMIGVGFHLEGDGKQIGTILRMLMVRYGVAFVLALGCYHFLPFSLEIRQALVILAFSPFAASSVAYTEEIKGDVGLASAVNSMSIVISIILIMFLLLIML